MAVFHFWDQSINAEDYNKFPSRNAFEQLIKQTVGEWLEGSKNFELKTSGSTGKPKTIQLKREQVHYSAYCTLKACGLSSGMRALLCINPEFIGGKMMIIRALVGDLDLYLNEPKSNPLQYFKKQVDFAAFVPLQIHEILKTNRKKLEAIGQVIIGGASVAAADEKSLSSLENNIYSTYGMTETVSHIALRQIAPAPQNYFKTLGDVSISIDDSSCLVIRGSVTDHKEVVTNDVVEIISNNKFRWVGRADNVINSGGYKVHPEKVEARLSKHINALFFIGQSEDERLGNAVTLYVEGECNLRLDDIQQILLNTGVHKYETPQRIISIKEFKKTASGKVNRKAIQASYFP